MHRKVARHVYFEFKEFSTEKEHLKERTEHDDRKQLQNINDLKAQGKSVREIASLFGLSKSKVWRLIQPHKTRDNWDARDNK